MIYQDSFAANYILKYAHIRVPWFNISPGKQTYGLGNLKITLLTGVYSAPKRLRWQCTFKGTPLNLKHPARIFRALAVESREKYFHDSTYLKNKSPEEYEKIRIYALKSLLKTQDHENA